ncbi:MAG: PAS domain-containing protein, partial [Bacteroidota bacterium]
MNNTNPKSGLEALLEQPISVLFGGKESALCYLVDDKLESIQTSKTVNQLLGIQFGRLSDYHGIIAIEDLKRLQRFQRNAFINCEDYDCNYHIDKPDGSAVWLQEKGKVLLDPSGRFSGLLCQLTDITERKSLEDDLRSAMEMARFPMENPYPVFRVKECGQLLFANSPAVRLLEKLQLTDGIIQEPVFRNHLATAIEQKKSFRYSFVMNEEQTYSIFIAPAIAEN